MKKMLDSPTDEKENEDIYWFFCKETNIKLLPTFYETLQKHTLIIILKTL